MAMSRTGRIENIGGTDYLVETCDRCSGSGTGYDITCADKINAGPFAGRCPRCSGRAIIIRAMWSIEIEAYIEKSRREAPAPVIGDLPEWM